MNPNGTYVATAQNGAQGQFGANLPTVNVGTDWLTGQPNYTAAPPGSQARAFLDWVSAQPVQGQTPGVQEGGGAYYNPDMANQPTTVPGALPETNSPEALALAQSHYDAGVEIDVGIALDKLERGDLSGLEWLPKEDLEAMGLSEIAGAQPAGGASDPARRGAQGIGTGVDESKDMTPAQKEARYWHNKEVEFQFLREKRWDEDRHKFVTVGEYLRKEKGKYNKKGRRRGGGGGGGGQPSQPVREDKTVNYSIQQYGVVNFNTATG